MTKQAEQAYQRAWYLLHKAEKAAYYQAHKAKILARMKTYYLSHKAKKSAYNKKYSTTHKAEIAIYMKAWNEAHQAEKAACNRVWQESHMPERAAYQKAWRQAHRAEIIAYKKAHKGDSADACARRRAWKRGAFVEKVLRALVYLRDEGRCHICGKKVGKHWHLDHLIALARGGEHSYRNTAVSHAKCNRRKGSKAGAQLRLF